MRLPLPSSAALLTACALTGAIFMGATALAQQAEGDAPADTENTLAAEHPMTVTRLGEIIATLDPDNRNNGAQFQMTIEDVPILIVTDARADRMRAMVPIRSAADMTSEEITRVMQANFEALGGLYPPAFTAGEGSVHLRAGAGCELGQDIWLALYRGRDELWRR